MNLPEQEFRQSVRMSKESFQDLVLRIKTHPIFHNNSNCPQRPVHIHTTYIQVWLQLMVTLERMGLDGNGASVGRIARGAGIGNGSVTLYVRRVMEALLALENEMIKWPNEIAQLESSAAFEESYGLQGCVGIVDGTHVHMMQRPAVDGECYWTRKCRYSLNATIVCDHLKRIIYYQIGYPGTVFDNTCFSVTELSKNPLQYFGTSK